MIPFLLSLIVVMGIIIIYLVFETKKQFKKGSNEIFKLFLDGAYEQRINWFKTLNKYYNNRPSVFVGDSITQEFMLTEMFNGYQVCNRGIGGDTTKGVLNRLDDSIFDLNPSQVFLMIGTNDIGLYGATSDEIVFNIKEICVKSIQKIPDLKFNLVSVTPVSEQIHTKIDKNTVGLRTNQQIDEINVKLKILAKELNMNYIDINSVLKDKTNNLNIEYTREGLHISPIGYEKIIDIYKKYLEDVK